MNYIDIRTTIDYMALQSLIIAMKRGKTTFGNTSQEDIYNDLLSELDEYRQATDGPSEHLPQYTQKMEELADIIIVGMTELNKLCGNANIRVSDVLIAKTEFNMNRKD